MRKRSRLDLILEVLEAVYEEGDSNPTRLSLRVNLSYDRLKKLLDELEKRRLIEISPSNNRKGSMRVTLTREGEKLMLELKRLKRVVEDYGLI
ncbi:MAG: winged helix-turn-helix domain-containing protein [Acidilobaceae archaeon]